MLWHGLWIWLLGSSATFAPLMADASLWFVQRIGIAVAVCASGNPLAGGLWPPTCRGWSSTTAGAAPTQRWPR